MTFIKIAYNEFSLQILSVNFFINVVITYYLQVTIACIRFSCSIAVVRNARNSNT